VAFSLACIVLGNETLQNELQETEGFKYSDVLYLLHSTDKVIPLQTLVSIQKKMVFRNCQIIIKSSSWQ
jgi:hypothetical protein